jgi:SAM-dependent methyltransferase
VALDLRDDSIDGLGAAGAYLENDAPFFGRIAASFDALPLSPGTFDLAVFNASLHYALDLARVLSEARQCVQNDGRIVIIDSPFYARVEDGAAMVAEKRQFAERQFGDKATALMSFPVIEFLTRASLAEASSSLSVRWQRHRVRYPFWYEVRPLAAFAKGHRRPSRFDVWEGTPV